MRILLNRVQQLRDEIEKERPTVDPGIRSAVEEFNIKVRHYQQQAARAQVELEAFKAAVRAYNESARPHDQ